MFGVVEPCRSLLATSPRIYAEPAVDWYLCTGDVARSIRREEDDEISDLRDFRPPFDQDTLSLAEFTNKLFCTFSLSFTELLCPGLSEFSADEAGNDGVSETDPPPPAAPKLKLASRRLIVVAFCPLTPLRRSGWRITHCIRVT